MRCAADVTSGRIAMAKRWPTSEHYAARPGARQLGVMREAVEAKFRQHDDLRALLLGTGDAMLIEHTGHDDFWGDGGDGRGRNELGRILRAVRQCLRDERGD